MGLTRGYHRLHSVEKQEKDGYEVSSFDRMKTTKKYEHSDAYKYSAGLKDSKYQGIEAGCSSDNKNKIEWKLSEEDDAKLPSDKKCKTKRRKKNTIKTKKVEGLSQLIRINYHIEF